MISVTIPAYSEKSEYLEACLESVVNQKPIEATETIIIDDGSENSGEIERIAKDYGVIYYWQKNAGIGAARKVGVELASGDYIVTLASHDLLMPNFFEEMLKASRENPDAILYSDYVVIDGEGNQRGVFRAPRFESGIDFKIAVIGAAVRNTMFTAYTLFSPAGILKEHNFDPQWRYGEDLHHLLKSLFVDDVRFVHVPQTLWKYRAHPLNVTSQKWREIPENNRRIFEHINKLAGRGII